MARTTFELTPEAIERINELQEKFGKGSAAAKHRHDILMKRFLDRPEPMIALTPDGPIKNRAAERQEVLESHLRDTIRLQEIIDKLSESVKKSDGTVHAYRKVVSDMQSELRELREEVGQQDQITRDRNTFLKLCRETFSIRVDFLGINIQKAWDLLKFIFNKPPNAASR